MRALAFLGLAASIAILPAAAEARSDSKPPRVTTNQTRVMHHRWGPRVQGRWHAGWQAPGGWTAYHRPARGYVVPPYWFSPSFYVGNYAAYGLGHPPYGLAWSRYYDDAVLIDGRGTVYDSASGVDWDRHGYRDDYRAGRRNDGYGWVGRRHDGYDWVGRRNDGMGGAIIGGAVGALAGNRIAGRGNRLGGTLIGAGVGALAGMAVDKAEDRDRHEQHRDTRHPHPYDYDFGRYDERLAGMPEGTWTGNWDGRYVDGSNTRYEGTFRGSYEGPAGADYAAPAYAHPMPHHPGYPAYGYAYAAPMMATVMVPVTTTTTTYYEEDAAQAPVTPRPGRPVRIR
ncbi:MAG: RcnB family protein [Sphingomonadaceae bacterium]